MCKNVLTTEKQILNICLDPKRTGTEEANMKRLGMYSYFLNLLPPGRRFFCTLALFKQGG
jgi:hypothetical protein